MGELEDLVESLKTVRDELKVQVHLARKEVRDEWEELEEKLEDMAEKAQLEETGEGVKDAVKQLGQELKLGYARIRDAIKSD
jgi:hypothetical protein